jgi:F-type H+-transporting ATPase subunit b
MIPVLLIAAEEVAHDAGHAASEHAEVMDFGNFIPGITTLLVFLIVLAFLGLKVWPKITKGLDDRQNKILQEIRAAEESRAQAKAALAEYEKNLASAREEANQMIAKARTDAKAVAEELRNRNAAELADMKERATREIQSAKENAILELHSEAAMLASAMAGKILAREIAPGDQQRLIEESLRELQSVKRKS